MAQIKLNATYGLTGTLPAVSGANLTSLTSGNLTGALPAISGASLTGISAGKVLQVVTAISETDISSSSATYVDSGVSCAITPAATSSKVLVMWNQGRAFLASTQEMFCAAYVDIGGAGYNIIKDIVELRMNVPTGGGTLNLLHSPNTTSAVTYKMYYKRSGGTGTVYFHNSNVPPPNTFVLMEIGA